MSSRSERHPRELQRALGVHVLFLIVYAAAFAVLTTLWGNAFSLGAPDSPAASAEFAGAMWLLLVVGPVWLLLLAVVILWWRRGRRSLWRKLLVWDALLWLGVLVVLLLPSRRTRRLFVPAPATEPPSST
jgi:magnesium-transporting ATPase (P-type)